MIPETLIPKEYLDHFLNASKNSPNNVKICLSNAAKNIMLRQQNLVALKIWCIANNTIKAGMSKIESLIIDEK